LGLASGELDDAVGGEIRTRRIVVIDAATAVLLHPHSIIIVAVVLGGAFESFLLIDHGSYRARYRAYSLRRVNRSADTSRP
jgi:hypothetical protein